MNTPKLKTSTKMTLCSLENAVRYINNYKHLYSYNEIRSKSPIKTARLLINKLDDNQRELIVADINNFFDVLSEVAQWF